MALAPRDVPINRSEVAGWLNIFQQADPATVGSLRDFLVARVAAKKMDDTEVNTSEVDGFGDTATIVDMIMADLESYGYSG